MTSSSCERGSVFVADEAPNLKFKLNSLSLGEEDSHIPFPHPFPPLSRVDMFRPPI